MATTTVLVALIGFSVICGAVSEPPDTIDFFPNIRDNLTRVTWAHAVNSAAYLEEVLEGQIMMIEADIVLGTLIDDPSGESLPIMGHPPATTSDISLEQFLGRIQESNSNASRSVKGVKLDFKSIDVFERSADIIQSLYTQVDYPIWINADILRGPVLSQGTPVDATRFLQGCKPYPAAMLSPGWTTAYGGIIRNGSYSEEHISEMLKVLNDNDVQQKVTYPIRAGLGANSLLQVQRLLMESPAGATITIWSSESDYVNVDRLRELIVAVGVERVYVDVPKDLMDQLNLPGGPIERS